MKSPTESGSRPPAFLPLAGILAVLAALYQLLMMGGLDPDMFWHLRVADQLLADGIGPLIDDIAFASITTPWTPYSWLAELAMREIWLAGGYRATLIAQSMMVGGIVFFLVAAARQSTEGSWVGAIWAVAAIFPLIIPPLMFRPVTFALLILTIILWLLQRDKRMGEQTRAAWLIPPLTVVATNMHLFAALSPIWIGIHFFNSILQPDHPQLLDRAEVLRRRNRRLSLLLLTIAATAATPMLPGVIESVVYYSTADPMVTCRYCIPELFPLYLRRYDISLLLIVLLFILLLRNLEKLAFIDWLGLIVAAVLTIERGRYLPLLALCLLPAVSMSVQNLSDRRLFDPLVTKGLYLTLALMLAALVWKIPPATLGLDDWDRLRGPHRGYPSAAADFVVRNIPVVHGRVINEFDWGGYLGWRLGNRFKIFHDGRTQVFPPEFWHATYLGTHEQRKAYLAQIVADAAILPAKGHRFDLPLLELGWQEVYADERAKVLTPPFSIYTARRRISGNTGSSTRLAMPWPGQSPEAAAFPSTP